MSKYLIKKDVDNILKEYASKAWNDDWKPTHETVRGDTFIEASLIIDDMPTADVPPMLHGRWITKAEDYYKSWQDSGRSWDDMPYFITGEHIACSECFTEYDICTEGIERWTGCPCCLARMDGDING